MTERGERIVMQQQDVGAIEIFRGRVEALYADVRSWLADDGYFRLAQSSSTVTESIGQYTIDRMSVSAAGQRLLDFRPAGVSLIVGDGQIDVTGTIDHALLLYFESSPAFTTTVMNPDRTSTHESTTYLFNAIDRPGWYWIEARHRDAQLFNRQTLYDMLEEISDFEREGT